MSVVRQLRPVTNVLLTKRQLAAHLGRSTRWVEMRMREGLPSIPPTSRFPQRRFRLADVEEWIAAGERKRPSPLIGRIERLEAQVARLAAIVERLKDGN
jgi:hypothetical protein